MAPRDHDQAEHIRVLVTGYGPFGHVDDNPSWLAVEPLHNTIVRTSSHSLHVTALGPIKVAYKSVLRVVPGLYAKPPVLPPSGSEDGPVLEPEIRPPPGGYDFIFHLGVGLPGQLSIEQVGHKSGYELPDVDGELAPMMDDSAPKSAPSAARQAEAARLGIDADQEHVSVRRGFSENYERFPDNLYTEIDAKGLLEHLERQGETRVEASIDAGNFLCDYITFCSLAESQRPLFYPGEVGLRSKSLFMHVPPEGLPHSIQEMREAVRQVIAWVCTKEAALPP